MDYTIKSDEQIRAMSENELFNEKVKFAVGIKTGEIGLIGPHGDYARKLITETLRRSDESR